MSVWTHVNGTIRVDGLCMEEEKFRNLCDQVDKLFSKDSLPSGSEGPFDVEFFKGPDSGIEMFRICLWGDLRDYGDSMELENWFKDVCTSLSNLDSIFGIRQAVFQVEIEGQGTQIFQYRSYFK